MTPSREMQIMVDLALAAGNAIMAIYATDFVSRKKSDASPVTEADEVAEAIILAGLAKNFPQIPVIAEEAVTAGHIPEIADEFFLVDPLDGTKEFLSRNGEFTVNIAWIKNGTPMLGVVFAPALKLIYWGEAGLGAAKATSTSSQIEPPQWQKINVRQCPREGATVLASRSHNDAATEAYLANFKVAKLISAGSSLKFCTLAEGNADLYPRFGRTMEWDIAAGHAVLSAAGGKLMAADGSALCYGKTERGFDNPAFIASAQ